MNRSLLLSLCLLATVAFPGSGWSQDSAVPEPKVNRGDRILKFDFPELLVGTAEYDEGPTGTTVLYFPDGVKAAVDVRGGSPGTVNAAALMNSREEKMMDAVVLSGGSWYGLSAATGVANGIKELKAAEGEPNFIAGVLGAIIYDVGGRRMSRITPDDRLGRAAVKAAKTGQFPLGARGGGRFAMQGSYFGRPFDVNNTASWSHSGQGGAFRQIGPTKIGVFTVVNSLGTIVDRDGRVVRCSRNDPDAQCPLIAEMFQDLVAQHQETSDQPGPTGNTTITLVVTNQKMPFADLQRMAKQVHGSMGRAIQPFATADDGDVLYAATTDQVENPDLSSMDLSVIASEVAWDAILSSVPELPAPPLPTGRVPSTDELQPLVGDYEFSEFSRVGIQMEGGRLVGMYGGIGQIYFWGPEVDLIPADNGDFLIDFPSRDVLRFELQDGEVTGLTLNPGPWAIHANKVHPD
jgi:L-aminopeptidase/D-esterase-like protein